MTERGAKSLILSSALVVGTTSALDSMLPQDKGGKGQLPSPRILIGTAIAFSALSVLAGFAPNLAGAWAILILTLSVLRTGAPIVQRLVTA